MAAGTLDASTKIYAVRVDAVHADAYRVLGGLGSETKPKESGYLFLSWVCLNITIKKKSYSLGRRGQRSDCCLPGG